MLRQVRGGARVAQFLAGATRLECANRVFTNKEAEATRSFKKDTRYCLRKSSLPPQLKEGGCCLGLASRARPEHWLEEGQGEPTNLRNRHAPDLPIEVVVREGRPHGEQHSNG